jgi:uncharacterized Zn finger protein
MGDRFSEDPFVLFQLRGRTRSQLLGELAARRREGIATPISHAPHPLHAAIGDPVRWWRYDAALDPDLVVITPALEGELGLDGAGPLPLAIDPRFPEANQLFLERLRQQGTAMGQLAMVRAMAAGNENGDATADPSTDTGHDSGNDSGNGAGNGLTTSRSPGGAA